MVKHTTEVICVGSRLCDSMTSTNLWPDGGLSRPSMQLPELRLKVKETYVMYVHAQCQTLLSRSSAVSASSVIIAVEITVSLQHEQN